MHLLEFKLIPNLKNTRLVFALCSNIILSLIMVGTLPVIYFGYMKPIIFTISIIPYGRLASAICLLDAN